MIKVKELTKKEKDELKALSKRILRGMDIVFSLNDVDFVLNDNSYLPSWIAYNNKLGVRSTFDLSVVSQNAILNNIFKMDIHYITDGFNKQMEYLQINPYEDKSYGNTNITSIISLLIAVAYNEGSTDNIGEVNAISIASGAFTHWIMCGLGLAEK